VNGLIFQFFFSGHGKPLITETADTEPADTGARPYTYQQELFCDVRFEVLTAVLLKIQLFWFVMLCQMSGSKGYEGL
jgi:hypothetical protein